MKNKIWVFQIPFILVFTAALYVHEAGSEGTLGNAFLREKAYPALLRVSSAFTDLKFKVRGVQKPKNKIVVVDIDQQAIAKYGRWPWHRDITARLIDRIFMAKAKAVGLDIVFSEPDRRLPDGLPEILKSHQLGALADTYETDKVLADVSTRRSDRLVQGWASENFCQPKFKSFDDCPVTLPDALAMISQNFNKFSYTAFHSQPGFDPQKTPVVSAVTPIANIPEFMDPAKHAGYFNTVEDPDGYTRRTPLVAIMGGVPYPSLALEMARVGLGENLQITLDQSMAVASLGFVNSKRNLPVNRLGLMDVNFRGPRDTFHYIHACDLIGCEDAQDPGQQLAAGDTGKNANRQPAAASPDLSTLDDAYVFVGVSAIGANDNRSFPFDSNVPGVEGHASILDNLLSDDALIPSSVGYGKVILFLLMTLGALVFGYFWQKLESVPALGLFAVLFSSTAFADTQLFKHGYNPSTCFFYIEMASIFVFTVAVKYVLEERSKKFIRGAFAKYVAPAVVDSILKDPSKLSLEGERRDLTILFSDIRGFTTFSERMEAKQLTHFLNDYLGIMTKIVFAHDGTLDKYIGDAVMAFWGAPLDQPKHASKACQAAAAMMKALGENRERFKSQYGVEVNIGVGVNSGTVNVGNMGSENNFEYTVIGDHVNLASRLEGLTKYYRVSIVTSRFTFDSIKQSGDPALSHRTLDFVKVKGKKTAVELIQVLDREYPAEGLKQFEEARALYSQQKWDAAIEKFRQASSTIGGSPDGTDGPSEMYIERCQEFKLNPPEQGWDGSWEMHSK